MEFIDPHILQYAEDFSSAESILLKKMNRETHSDVLMPRMLSGHLQGRVLSMISKMIRPKNILEIGTYTGYSAICLSEGLPHNAKLITIDINEELEDRVRKYFEESGYKDQIQYVIGNALDIIPQLKETFDLVFIDADKENYSRYYDLVFDKVNSGGFIIADNVLWSGKVLPGYPKQDKDTQALITFNEYIKNDERAEKVLLPIRDGLFLIRKK